MQGRRIGTLTLGLLFTVTGISYLLVNIFDFKLGIEIIKWWPLILISLGIEILAYNRKSSKQNCNIHFDGISLILIVLIIIFSFSANVLTRTSNEIFNSSSRIYYEKHFHNNVYTPTSSVHLQ